MAAMISPPTRGRIWYPDSVADDPRTTWNQRGMKITAAKKPMAARKMANTLEVKARSRNRWSGRMGSLARDSTTRKTTAMIVPRIIRPPTSGSVHSPNCFWVSPTRMGTRAATRSAAPR